MITKPTHFTPNQIKAIEGLEALVQLVENNKALAEKYDRFLKQLFFILINNGGRLTNLRDNKPVDNVDQIDWSKITITVGYDSCSIILKENNKIITTWSEVPLNLSALK